MSNKAVVAGLLILTALAGGAALALKNKIANITVSFLGPSSVTVGATNSYEVSVFSNNKPVPNVTVDLKDTSGSIGVATGITNSAGNAVFDVNFSSAGTDTLYGEYNGIKSPSITVTITSSTSTPPPSCTSCFDCPSGYNCINGTCEELIPASISMPVTLYPDSLYFQYTNIENNFLYVDNILAVVSPNSNSCPGSPNGGSSSYTSLLTITGKILDSNGDGVNGVNVNASVAGVGNWQAGDSNHTFTGTTSVSFNYGETQTTDCAGQFVIVLAFSTSLTYAHSFDSGYNSKFFAIPIPTCTLTVSSGNLANAETIISFDDYISAYNCEYVNGAPI